MRIIARPLLRLGQRYFAQRFDGPRASFAARHASMRFHRLSHLIADAHHRIQRRHGLLEDHGDARATHLPHLLLRQLQQFFSFQPDAAGSARLRRQQPHDGQRGHRFSRAGFAHQRQHLAARDAERNVMRRGQRAVRTGECDREILERDQSSFILSLTK